MEEVVQADPAPEVRVASKAVLIHGQIPMTKNPVTILIPEEKEAQENLEAVLVGPTELEGRPDPAGNVRHGAEAAEDAAVVTLVKMLSTTPAIGATIFHR